jgi:hypothetical protein
LRYTLTYGRKVNPAQYETLHVEISQEFDDEETPSEAGYTKVRAFVLKKIEEELSTYPKAEVNEASTISESTSQDEPLFYSIFGLSDLPWTSYQTKDVCKPGEEGWIFSNSQGAEDLAKIINREGSAHVMIDGVKMVCRFSGPTDITTKLPRFISRRKY